MPPEYPFGTGFGSIYGSYLAGQEGQQQQAWNALRMRLAQQEAQQQFAEFARQNQYLSTLGAASKGLDILGSYGQPGPQTAPTQAGLPGVQREALPPLPTTLPQVPDYQTAFPPTPSPAGAPAPRSIGGFASGFPAVDDKIWGLESGRRMAGVPDSPAGAVGPMQVMPATAAGYGVGGALLRDPQVGKALGDRIAWDLYGQAGAGQPSPQLREARTLVGYDAGPGAMRRFQAQGDRLDGIKLDPAYRQAVIADLQKGMPPETHQQSSDAAIAAAGQTPPQLIGRVGPNIYAQILQRVLGSDAPNDVKGLALVKLAPLMSEDGQQQLENVLKILREKRERAKETREEGETTGPAIEFAPGQWGFQTKGGPIKMLPPGARPQAEVTAQTRIESDPRKAAFGAFVDQWRSTHGGQDPPPAEMTRFINSMSQPRSAAGMSLRQFLDDFPTMIDSATGQPYGRAPNHEEIVQFQAQQAAATAEGRTVGTAAGGVEMAGNKAEALIPLVRQKSHELSDKTWRTNYPDVNSLLMAADLKIGGRTIVEYGELINALRYTYAQVLARGGQVRVADLNHFDEIFNKAWSQGQVDAALDQMATTIQRERGAVAKTRQQIGQPPGASETGGTPSAAPAAAAPSDGADMQFNPATGKLE